MALIEIVRQALRIKSEVFDKEIRVLIDTCKRDMAMAGVLLTDEEDPVFQAACMQYCKANFGQDTEVGTRERWGKCYRALRDSMALSKEYGSLQNQNREPRVAPVQPENGEDQEDDVQG